MQLAQEKTTYKSVEVGDRVYLCQTSLGENVERKICTVERIDASQGLAFLAGVDQPVTGWYSIDAEPGSDFWIEPLTSKSEPRRFGSAY